MFGTKFMETMFGLLTVFLSEFFEKAKLFCEFVGSLVEDVCNNFE